MSAESLTQVEAGEARESTRSAWLNKKLLIAVGVLAIAVAFLIYNAMGASAEFYMTVTELSQSTENLDGQRIRMGGDVEDGTIVRGEIGDPIQFVVTDGTTTMPVVFDGTVPDIFSDEAQVIASGTYENGVFYADELLTKCPSKFEAEEGVSK